MGSRKFATIDDYLSEVNPDAVLVLGNIRKMVKQILPEAVETISYNMPAFKLPKVFFYFAGFKKHVGFYPPIKTDAKLIRELAPYRGEKGNLQFPLDKPFPYDLMEKVIIALHAQSSR